MKITTLQLEQLIIDVNASSSLAKEIKRLGTVFTNPSHAKAYQKMNAEQFIVACKYFETLKVNDSNIDSDYVDHLYELSESCFGHTGNNFESCKLIENDLTSEFRAWITDNNHNVELNCGMVFWISCAIEGI